MRYKEILIEARYTNYDELVDYTKILKLVPVQKKFIKLLIDFARVSNWIHPARWEDTKQTAYDKHDMENGTLFTINHTKRLVDLEPHSKYQHISDWLNASGEWDRFKGVETIDQAWNLANQYFNAKNKKASEKEDWEGIETIMKFKNGWHIVQLDSEQALAREGKLMNHCIGDYCDDVTGYVNDEDNIEPFYRVYSLRDKNNKPYVTIGVEMGDVGPDSFTDWMIDQIMGNSNSVINDKFIPYMKAFIKHTGIKNNKYGTSINPGDLVSGVIQTRQSWTPW